ncbi:MAG: L,D-transpeptidase family protein [Gammaproteobacteria bacterium]|nr:L,D-transpeptidase family protein [Gammaproteobacteria bacterium]
MKCRFLMLSGLILLAVTLPAWAENEQLSTDVGIRADVMPQPQAITPADVSPAATPDASVEGQDTDAAVNGEPTPAPAEAAGALPEPAVAEEPQTEPLEALSPSAKPLVQAQTSPEVAAAIRQLLSSKAEQPGAPRFYHRQQLQGLYQANGYQALWGASAIADFSRALDALVLDGLKADAYRLESIAFFLLDPTLQPEDAAEQALVDLSLSESLLQVLYNLRYGKVDPEMLDADFNYPKARDAGDHTQSLRDWISQAQIAEAFAWARPKQSEYRWLQEALVDYCAKAGQGGWRPIPAGKPLKPGASDARTPLLRARLQLPLERGADEEVYDAELEKAVRAFQDKRSLNVDGVVGPVTLGALNISIEQRIEQIRANLERERWFDALAKDEYLLIDVAGYKLRWISQGEVIWQERVQVGKKQTKTPIFQDQLEHLIFNPTWSVPPGINQRTILPSLKLDPGYLDKKGYMLLDDNGKRIDPYSIDWKSLDRMPYIVRQPPGNDNALGRVKFMFPNKHHVFLHDTNHRELFSKDVRTTSSGCVRLQDPFVLAERLLGRQGWDRARIDKTLASGQTLQANLEKPLPIYIRYLTTEASAEGVGFRDDIYDRDPKLLEKLDGPFRIHLADLPKAEQTRLRAQVKSASKVANLPVEPEVIGIPEEIVVEEAPKPEVKTQSNWKSGFIDL